MHCYIRLKGYNSDFAHSVPSSLAGMQLLRNMFSRPPDLGQTGTIAKANWAVVLREFAYLLTALAYLAWGLALGPVCGLRSLTSALSHLEILNHSLEKWG